MSKVFVDEHEPLVDVEDPPFKSGDVNIREDKWVEAEYQILDFLGRGKFGEVKRCREKLTGREFAAKFIPCTPQDKKEVQNEIVIMKKLHHRRIIQLYEAYATDRETCLVLEIILGGELFDRVICDDFVLTERACVCFMRQVCEGMRYMHSRDIIHLDMKPENILCLSKAGNRIKIIDFGLAQEFNPKKDLRVLFGTPEFMAPEVIQYETINQATDMWSVGVICYVLLSGLSPFMGDTDGETLTNVIKGDYDFDYAEFDEISEDAMDLIANLLVKDKRKRFSADECLEHSWLRKPSREKRLSLTKKTLKHYVYKHKWMKAVNAIIALRRMGAQLGDKTPPQVKKAIYKWKHKNHTNAGETSLETAPKTSNHQIPSNKKTENKSLPPPKNGFIIQKPPEQPESLFKASETIPTRERIKPTKVEKDKKGTTEKKKNDEKVPNKEKKKDKKKDEPKEERLEKKKKSKAVDESGDSGIFVSGVVTSSITGLITEGPLVTEIDTTRDGGSFTRESTPSKVSDGLACILSDDDDGRGSTTSSAQEMVELFIAESDDEKAPPPPRRSRAMGQLKLSSLMAKFESGKDQSIYGTVGRTPKWKSNKPQSPDVAGTNHKNNPLKDAFNNCSILPDKKQLSPSQTLQSLSWKDRASTLPRPRKDRKSIIPEDDKAPASQVESKPTKIEPWWKRGAPSDKKSSEGSNNITESTLTKLNPEKNETRSSKSKTLGQAISHAPDKAKTVDQSTPCAKNKCNSLEHTKSGIQNKSKTVEQSTYDSPLRTVDASGRVSTAGAAVITANDRSAQRSVAPPAELQVTLPRRTLVARGAALSDKSSQPVSGVTPHYQSSTPSPSGVKSKWASSRVTPPPSTPSTPSGSGRQWEVKLPSEKPPPSTPTTPSGSGRQWEVKMPSEKPTWLRQSPSIPPQSSPSRRGTTPRNSNLKKAKHTNYIKLPNAGMGVKALCDMFNTH